MSTCGRNHAKIELSYLHYELSTCDHISNSHCFDNYHHLHSAISWLICHHSRSPRIGRYLTTVRRLHTLFFYSVNILYSFVHKIWEENLDPTYMMIHLAKLFRNIRIDFLFVVENRTHVPYYYATTILTYKRIKAKWD